MTTNEMLIRSHQEQRRMAGQGAKGNHQIHQNVSRASHGRPRGNTTPYSVTDMDFTRYDDAEEEVDASGLNSDSDKSNKSN